MIVPVPYSVSERKEDEIGKTNNSICTDKEIEQEMAGESSQGRGLPFAVPMV
jgi:hypothetical protein